jgi:Transposase DDE domain
MGIRASMPVPDWGDTGGSFGLARFRYAAEEDLYRCPEGQILRRTHTSEVDQRIQYRAPGSTCRACPLKAHCTPATKTGRSVWRSFGEEYLERVRAYQPTAADKKALRKRQVWVEPLFAEAKEWHGSRRFRLRRLWRVNSEALLTAAGQNLKRLLAHHGGGRRPLPSGAALALTLLVGRRWASLGVIGRHWASLPLRCGVAWELFLILGLTTCPGAQERTLTQPMWQLSSNVSPLFQQMLISTLYIFCSVTHRISQLRDCCTRH